MGAAAAEGGAGVREPGDGEGWQDIRKMFRRACVAAGVAEIWFHDLRRSFVTKDDLKDAVRRLEGGSEGSWSRSGPSEVAAPKSAEK